MRHLCLYILLGVLWPCLGYGNNIRIDSVDYDPGSVGGAKGTVLKMRFLVAWENSWHDDYNYDAAYVFFKFKKKETRTNVSEPWHHLFLSQDQVSLEDADYDYWLSPLSAEGTNFNTGIYIFRKNKGQFAKDSVWVNVAWDVIQQMISPQLTTEDVNSGLLQVVGHAIEMVYIPRGAYRIGDGVSAKSFRRQAFPLPAQYDIVSTKYTLTATDGDPALAADRQNDNTGSASSEWRPTSGAGAWWMIDFGAGNSKRITYFGVNGSKTLPNNYPKTFRLMACKDPSSPTSTWDTLWVGAGRENWTIAHDAYPVEKALKIPDGKVGSYRAYKVYIDAMNTGTPAVASIGMTETEFEGMIDYSCLIDSPVTTIDSIRSFGASDGTVWTTNATIPKTFPNGYCGFYAMKYELSQDQYVRFLNKLTYLQQDGLLDGRLATLNEGEYIFGDPAKADQRNGIVLATKIEGMPAVFACDLDKTTPAGQDGDGQNVACNYMNIRDMLAYADWACLRPLTEMEYEKMCRPFYPSIPVRKSYAWGTTKLDPPGEINGLNTEWERAVSGNANWGATKDGPLRVGAFAPEQNASLEKAGAGFWGSMDLSGNLAEIYYNVNGRGITLILPETGNGVLASGHKTAHGDGSLNANGTYNGVATKQWSEEVAKFGMRGGSYASDAEQLATSDRSNALGYFNNITDRDSTATFRLGRTAPTFPELISLLITEKEETTESGDRNDFFLTSSYMLKGNKPENDKGGIYTYIWYSSESGGDWKVMEGQTGQNLYFDKYRNDTINVGENNLNLSLKRKVITPYTDSETSSARKVDLITPPFTQEVEIFKYTGNTYQVQCNWGSAITRKWGFDKAYPGLSIDATTGVISGLNSYMCDVVVTLECPSYPGVIYTKKVKEYRDFVYTGGVQSVNLPVGTYQLECWGAEGGGRRLSGNANSGLGGKGGYSVGTMNVTANVLAYVMVGGQGGYSNSGVAAGGYNGGGAGYGSSSSEPGNGGGGGADIRIATNNVNYRVIVAGGGGGGGEDSNDPYGHGGGITGFGYSAYDATQTAAGSGGSFGTGGTTNRGDGGGGGGGWYGGGTLSYSTANGTDTQGGGGGSGFVWTAGTAAYVPSGYAVPTTYYLKNAKTIDGNSMMPAPAGGNQTGNLGHGYVRITVK